VPSAFFFISGLQRKKIAVKKGILIVIIAYIGFEFLGLFGLHGTFDWFDIIATLLSGFLTLIILSLFSIKEI
jgi:hypothetical protein